MNNTLQWPKQIHLKIVPQALDYKIKIYNELLGKFPDLEIECDSFEDFISHKEILYSNSVKENFTGIEVEQFAGINRLYLASSDKPIQTEKILKSTQLSFFLIEKGFKIFAKPIKIDILNYESWEEALLQNGFCNEKIKKVPSILGDMSKILDQKSYRSSFRESYLWKYI